MKRVMIIGQPGSGKSTFARALGEITYLPVVHIDREVHWQAGWVEVPRAEKTRRCQEIHAREAWIFEGGHSATWADRLDRADTLIWLDVPLAVRLWRVVKRTVISYGRTRPDLPAGCPEQFSLEVFQIIWRTRHTARIKCRHLFEGCPETKARHRLRTSREARHYLGALRAATAVGNLGIPHR